MCRMKKHEKERRSFGSVDSCLFHYEGRRPKETFTLSIIIEYSIHPGLKVTSQQICQMWSASGIASCMTLENRNITSKKSSNCFHLHPHFCDENEWHTGHTECSLQQLEDWPHLKRSGLWIIWGCHLAREAKAPKNFEVQTGHLWTRHIRHELTLHGQWRTSLRHHKPHRKRHSFLKCKECI